MNDDDALAYLSKTLTTFVLGQPVAGVDPSYLPAIKNPDLKQIFSILEMFIPIHNQGIKAITDISNGKLDFNYPLTDPIFSPIKDLQSKLKHLIWQTHCIAAGDYSQQIDFLGDFSKSYNQLIQSLKERKDIEFQLHESNKKFQLIAENSQDVIWKIDLESLKFTYISPSCFNLLGYTPDEIINQPFSMVMPPHSMKKVFIYIDNSQSSTTKIKDKFKITDRFQNTHKDGRLIEVEITANYIDNNESEPIEFMGVTRDVTKRSVVEKALKDSEAKLSKLLEKQTFRNKQLFNQLQYIYNNASNAFAFFDIDGDIIRFSSCNKLWANNIGYEPEDLINMDISLLADTDTSQTYAHYIQKAIKAKESTHDFIFWKKKHLHIIVIPIKEENSDEIKTCGALAYNISDRIEAEEKIKETEERFFSIFNNSNDAIVLLTMDFEVLEVNTMFHHFYGTNIFPKDNVLENYYPKEYHGLIRSLIKHVQQDMSIPTFECEMYRFNKSVIPVEISASLIYNHGVPMLLCFMRDISIKKEMERMVAKVSTQIEAHERRRLASDLHDNVGPLLSSMNMYLSVLSKKIDTDVQREIITDVQKILKETIGSVREISNNLSPQILQSFGLTAAIKLFFESKKKLIHIEIKNQLEDLRFDEIKEIMIYNIIKEVFNNSLKYSEASEVKLELSEKDHFITVTYIDNGIGFNLEEKLAAMNDRMGLISIFNRVKILNGNYNLQTSPGKGFFLEIVFPIKHI